MQDLDQITSRLKQKLTPVYSLPQHLSSEPEAPVSCHSTGHATLTSTHSGLSTISTLHLQHSQRDSSRTQESELLLTASNEAESSRTGVDSGVLSVTQSSEKYQDQEALDSQRSDGHLPFPSLARPLPQSLRARSLVSFVAVLCTGPSVFWFSVFWD